jgi:hypothetical protein
MKRELIVIPKIKLHPSKIILYNEIHWTPSKPSRNKSERQNTTLIQVEKDGKIELKRVHISFLNSSRTSNGILSKQAKKKLQLSIEYFLLINKPQSGKSGNTGRHYENKIAFITLTLPSKQVHTDNEIKSKCLNQFMIEISRYYKVSQYVWRAEYQKNGNIHFHILVNRFIPWNEVRNRWNRIINKLGYIDRYRQQLQVYHQNGFTVRKDLINTWSVEKQYKAYLEGLKTDWHNPNSIDVHGIMNITNIKNYLTKYLTKTEQQKEEHLNCQFEEKKEIGRIWGASTIFSNIKGATTEIDSQLEENLKNLEEHSNSRIFKSDYFTIIDISIETLESCKCYELLYLFFNYMKDAFQYSYQFHL